MHNILVVEDDKFIASTLKEMLESNSVNGDGIPRLQVDVVGSVSGALVLMKDKEYASICLDLKLPDSSGAQTYRTIRGNSPAAFICVLSGEVAEVREVQEIADDNTSIRIKPDSPGAVNDIIGTIAVDLTLGVLGAAG